MNNETTTTSPNKPNTTLMAAQVAAVAAAIELDHMEGGTASSDWATVLIHVTEQLREMDRTESEVAR